jgi:cation diffusion facilitator CzcD-associated flavoprotein CzcO
VTLIDERPVARARAAEAPECDVAIVGAGPYGLSAAAHLGAIDGLDVRIFGPPMSFWERNMPAGMLLRSPWVASNLSHPGRQFTLDHYRADTEQAFGAPVPLDRFVDYGRWFQRQTVPGLDDRTVRRVEALGDGFVLELEDGEPVRARRVVVAAGIAPFAHRPPLFDTLRPGLVSHAVEHRDLRPFDGRRVVVAGGGQSALESAALLREAGADAEVVVRERDIYWLTRRWQHRMPVVSSMLYAWPDVGPAGVSHLVARPKLWRRMPRERQDRLARRAIRPAGAAWLVPRLREVPIRTGVEIAGAEASAGRIRLRLSDGAELTADHLLLGTGYRVDVARYAFLSRDLVARVARVDGHPRLTHGYESTVPGLHFVGAPAAWSHGPLMRFVAGADFAARSVARDVGAGRDR